MRTLNNYLIDEGYRIDEAFNQHTTDIYQLADNINLNPFNDDNILDDLNNFFETLKTITGDDIIFTYDEQKNSKIFKVSYDYYDELKSLIKNNFKNRFSILSDNGKSRKIRIGVIHKITGKISREIFETGSGSQCVTTAQQEQGTCKVWNAFVEETTNLRDFNLNDISFIKNIVSDISERFNNAWIRSFQKQVTLIIKYLKNIQEDYSNYTMERSGDGLVGSAYGMYINKYSKTLDGKKDNFDPSDTLLYKTSDANEIADWYKNASKSIKTKDDALKTKAEFKRIFFDTHKVIGISLKKITGVSNTGSYEEFNTNDNEILPQVSKYNILHAWKPGSSANNIQIECECDIDLTGVTTPTDDGISVAPNSKSIILIMRRFGPTKNGDLVAIDANIKGFPSLGKCPARYWRTLCNARDTEDLTKCLEDFQNWLKKNNTQTIKNGLSTILLGAVKKGELCFPFILIH